MLSILFKSSRCSNRSDRPKTAGGEVSVRTAFSPEKRKTGQNRPQPSREVRVNHSQLSNSAPEADNRFWQIRYYDPFAVFSKSHLREQAIFCFQPARTCLRLEVKFPKDSRSDDLYPRSLADPAQPFSEESVIVYVNIDTRGHSHGEENWQISLYIGAAAIQSAAIYDDHLKIVYMSAWSTFRQDGTIKVRYTLPMEVVMDLSSGYEDVLAQVQIRALPICRLV